MHRKSDGPPRAPHGDVLRGFSPRFLLGWGWGGVQVGVGVGVRAGCRCRLAVQVGWVRGCVCGITCFQKHGSAERFTKIVTTAGDEQVPPLRLPPRTPSDTCPPGAWSRASLVTTQGTGEVLNRPQVRRPQLSKDRADSALRVYTRSPTAGAVTVLLRTPGCVHRGNRPPPLSAFRLQ